MTPKPIIATFTDDIQNAPRHVQVFVDYLPQLFDKQRVIASANGILSKMKTVEDPRVVALLGCLLLEQDIEALLPIALQNYGKVSDELRSFYLKIEIVRAAKMVPSGLLDIVQTVNTVRNKFAHRLDIEDFDQLPEDVAKKLEQVYVQFTDEGDGCQSDSMNERYKKLILNTSMTLNVFGSVAERIRSFEETKDFESALRDYLDRQTFS